VVNINVLGDNVMEMFEVVRVMERSKVRMYIYVLICIYILTLFAVLSSREPYVLL
jgi:hypothetical protein